MVLKDFEGALGDKRQEIVFMGSGMDQKAIRAALDACLLTDKEMALGPEGWFDFEDPLDDWDVMSGEDDDDDDDDDGSLPSFLG